MRIVTAKLQLNENRVVDAASAFAPAWARFAEVNLLVAEVGRKIGGKVEQNIASGVFQNACPIRMSYVLNDTGVPVPAAGYHVVSGADRKWYMYRIPEMMLFLERSFGKAEVTQGAQTPQHFAGKKGILVVRGRGWSNVVGHVTLGTVASARTYVT